MNSHHTVTILIIEDDESVRRTLADILELNGYTTLSASDGTEGLAVAKRDLPSVIITDLNMPGMTGFELLEAFRSDEMLRTIPVIVISAKVDRDATRHGMELGAADFITKPFSEDEVLHSITARLEKKELLDELDAFSHTLAHDLKTPLATLSGRLEILSMMLGKSDEALLRHQLSEARNSAVWLRGIIDELLLLAGVRRQTVTPVPLDMTAIVAEATAHLGNFLAQHSATLELPAAWPAAAGALGRPSLGQLPEQRRQIRRPQRPHPSRRRIRRQRPLRTLLGARPRTRPHRRGASQDVRAVLAHLHRESQRPRPWPFHRAPHHRKTRRQGRRHQRARRRHALLVRVARHRTPQNQTSFFRPMNILIIEDEESIRQVLRELLEINGHTVSEAADGAAGVDLAARRPDLILCDINMPKMDGYQTIEAIQRTPQCRDIPFIFLTAIADRAASAGTPAFSSTSSGNTMPMPTSIATWASWPQACIVPGTVEA